MKTCNRCGRDLPDGKFAKRARGTRRVLLPRCRECVQEDNRKAQKAWRRSPEHRAEAAASKREWYSKPENKLRVKDRQLRKDYGITLEEWQAKLAAQGGLCAVCKQPMTEKINVDHDHATGEVRDLLCSGCNGGLGLFRDEPALLIAAEAYLRRWGRG